MPEQGEQAPDFTLPDQYRALHTLAEYRGGWVLLYFYPKDDTPGCVKEACAIRDHFPRFQTGGLTVFGVSTDSIASHKKFVEKYSLPFTLLSDTGKRVIALYGITRRSSFLIAPDGTIAKVYEKVKPELHAEEVLRDLKELL